MFQEWSGFHIEVIARSIWQFRLQIQIVTVTSTHWNLRKMNNIGIFRSYLLPLWRSFFVCLTMLNSTVNILQWTSLWSLNMFQHTHYESWLILPFFDQVCLKKCFVVPFFESSDIKAKLRVFQCSFTLPSTLSSRTRLAHVLELICSNDITIQNTSHTKLSTKRPKNMTPKRCQAQKRRLKKKSLSKCVFLYEEKTITGPFAGNAFTMWK